MPYYYHRPIERSEHDQIDPLGRRSVQPELLGLFHYLTQPVRTWEVARTRYAYLSA